MKAPKPRQELPAATDTIDAPATGHEFGQVNVLPSGRTGQQFASSCPLAFSTPRACPFGGACHSCPAPVQAKLTISQPGNKYEQEADRVADQVMAMPEQAGRLQRECSDCEDEALRQPVEDEEEEEEVAPQLIQRQAEPGGPEEEEEEEETIAPKLLQRQVEGEEDEEEEEETVSPQAQPGRTPQVTPAVTANINALRGGGQPLPPSTRTFFEPRFGQDLDQVRIHTDTRAAESARAVNARAFTLGRDVVFGEGHYAPGTSDGGRLLAHELTHVVQQGAAKQLCGGRAQDRGVGNVTGEMNGGSVNHGGWQAIQRQVHNAANVKSLRKLLRDGDEEGAISLAAKLSPDEKQFVLESREFKDLAVSAFDNDEMYRAVRAMRGDLYRSLEWMFDEGTDWAKLHDVVKRAPSGHDRVRRDNRMKNQFVGELDDAEMATLVDLLGGKLEEKLEWMREEGTSWEELVKPKIQAAPQPERDLLKTDAWRDFFVDICSNATMAEAVDELKFDLETKLKWMREEGTSWEELVKPKIQAAPQPERDLLKTHAWRDFFVDICSNATMAEAVDELKFDLETKIRWMLEEGTSYGLVKGRVVAAAPPDRATALGVPAFLRKVFAELSWNDAAKTVELLGRNAPTAAVMLADATVTAALATAWAASAPAVTIWPRHYPLVPVGGCNPAPGTPSPVGVGHEEGGFVYLNLVTGAFASRAVPPGAQASLRLADPAEVAEAIVVGGYHTHLNVGPCWGAPFASNEDIAWATGNGVPLLIRGAFPGLAAISDASTGARRAHLAGNRGLPGAGGGIAPQAYADGWYDEV